MGSFLNLTLEEQRRHVATMLGFNPNDAKSWPLQIVDSVIRHAEHAADQTARDVVLRLGVQRQPPQR